MATARIDVVFIRKSTGEQEEQGQVDNVTKMLAALEPKVGVPHEQWYVGTVSRRKVSTNAKFNKMMALVEADRVGTIYVESQDRFGTANEEELFPLFAKLRKHGTRLYDLRAKRDLLKQDMPNKVMNFMNSMKSEQELKDTAYRSLRTRVSNFKARASWPTGPSPYGFGKACYNAEGRLLWVWQPVRRVTRQMDEKRREHFLVGDRHSPDEKGKLRLTDRDVRLPRKEKWDHIKLVPSTQKEFVENVRLIFDLYTRLALSRRQISARMNAEGRTFYERGWTHSLISQILTNAAYVGDIHFGKTKSGELYTWGEDGLVEEVTKANGKTVRRPEAEQIIKQNTHEGLIDRKTWEAAQAKIAAEKERTSFAPRNPAYYLKQIFVCGHCGKNMTGRMDTDYKTKKQTVTYVCTSWMLGKAAGKDAPCGMHRITHTEAEQMLMDKIKAERLEYEEAVSAGARANIEARLAAFHTAQDQMSEDWWRWVEEGAERLVAHLQTQFRLDAKTKERLNRAAKRFYRWGLPEARSFADFPLTLADFKAAIDAAEAQGAEQAKVKLAAVTAELKRVTIAWAKASDAQQPMLKEECNRLEAEMVTLRVQLAPLGERLRQLFRDDDARNEERDQLLAEWPALEAREKGEALRRLFHKVQLFWDRTWVPRSPTPSRPIKTDRDGRWRYTLLRDKTVWEIASTKLVCSK